MPTSKRTTRSLSKARQPSSNRTVPAAFALKIRHCTIATSADRELKRAEAKKRFVQTASQLLGEDLGFDEDSVFSELGRRAFAKNNDDEKLAVRAKNIERAVQLDCEVLLPLKQVEHSGDSVWSVALARLLLLQPVDEDESLLQLIAQVDKEVLNTMPLTRHLLLRDPVKRAIDEVNRLAQLCPCKV